MKTMLRLLLVSALVALPFGISKADPHVQGLIRIDDGPYYDHPTVDIWTDAGRYFIGETVEITVTVDRPSFVTVYNIDAAGRVRRLTRDDRGVWVTPGRPLYLPETRYSRLVAAGPTGMEELVAVASPVQFGHCDDLPFYGDRDYDRLPCCEHDRNGFIEKVNRRLMHERGFSNRSVARTTFWVEPAPYYRWPHRPGLSIDIGINIPLQARVYVDGVFFGIGPSCISALNPGRHRITVHTERGRKISREVTIPRDSRYRSDVRGDRDDRWQEKSNSKEYRQERGNSKKR